MPFTMTVMKGTYKNGQIVVFFSINSYCNCDFFCIFAEKLETMEAKHDVEKTTESRPSTVKPAKSSAYLDMISPQVLNDLQKKIVAYSYHFALIPTVVVTIRVRAIVIEI